MIIRDLFLKNIERPINGVIKADQRDLESIWQELDEYVVTGQLTDYFRRFFDAYLAGLDRPNDPVIASRMGVWVSGFFGSGKSHFIKILSYLLENIAAVNPENRETRNAIDFFDNHKVKDAMLRADMQRAVRHNADVILFNIDAKADSKSDRDVILQVFLRVFNEKLGFSGDAPHIAEMERYLVSKNVYDTFKAVFQQSNGNSWEAERDAFDFLRDDIVAALANALDMSEESAGSWFNNARDSYRINIEGFAKLVKDYLDTKPAGHRIVFLVDEVGQFIGDNTQLMLNLQTITEQLGTACAGRAWIVVTSQEDIDAAIGEANKAKSQDFSKIQGRFHTRLSLASSNTDEVIGTRLLSKTEEAHDELRAVFATKGDIINNQLAFSGEGVLLRGYKDAADYVTNYPFPPYQFFLLSKVFEAIRRAGATGKHLSKGERSLLDAFQTAAKALGDEQIDALVPLYDFYPAIDSFLDSSVRHSIDNADKEVGGLFEAFDIQLLKTLFLIRYIRDIVKGTVDNLATLCIDEIDCDKLTLKRKIQESLQRLEKQNLVSRNGEEWLFLTNEEQDIAREIGHEVVSYDEMARKLADLVFSQVWKDQTKVRHKESKADYEFNRVLDSKPWRNTSHELTLEIISPLNDEISLFTDAKCRMYSTMSGRAIVVLGQNDRLDQELKTLLQIERYIQSKYDSVSSAAKKILLLKKDENREREDRLRMQLDAMLAEASCYALGEPLSIRASSAGTVLDEVINYLVSNTYTKLAYLKPTADAFDEIRAVLTVDSIGQQSLLSSTEQANAQALREVREYLQLKASVSQVILDDVVNHFSGIPFGWKPEWEIVLLVARLFMSGEIKLLMDGSDLEPKAAVEPLSKAARFKQVAILKRKTTGAAELKKARDLYRDLFREMAPEDEDGLVSDFRAALQQWQQELAGFLALASQPHHPGKAEIEALQARIKKQLAVRDTFAFIEAQLKERNDWLDAEEDLHDLAGFYGERQGQGQILTWRRLLNGLTALKDNTDKLREDDKAAAALRELKAIRDNPRPYGQINRIEALLSTVEAVNQQLAAAKREHALSKLDEKIAFVQQDLDIVQASDTLRNTALRPLRTLKSKIEAESSIPQIFYLQEQAGALLDKASDQIAAHQEHLLAAQRAAEQQTAYQAQRKTDNNSTATASKPEVANKPAPTVNAPMVKPSKSIRASSLSPKMFLETEQDVEVYLTRLKTELLKAISTGQRVRID
ncbi:BREX system P-loop protein BrxC [Chromobacterium subtsugae]|uniref:BREX system P-loop protein BrxC n=1 Tax=Chromobacterium subtsugae TaxID=251747 RepID=UPI000640DA19|nr:BREX system P-loop protein BrxC [Chromobacterium subtsugae]